MSNSTSTRAAAAIRHLRRLAVIVIAAGAAVSATATPAFAHTVAGAGATNYHSRILSVSPQIRGLTVREIENGNKLEVINHTGKQLIILGYAGEPYLRVTPSGVEENLRSSAVYLNQSRFAAGVVVPPSADNKGVDWKQISSTPIAVWHDHRIHWASPTPPPFIAAAPGRRQHIFDWHVMMRLDTQPITITGSLDWIPGPSGTPWYGLTVLLLVGFALIAWRVRRLCAPLLVMLTATDVVHTLGVATDRARTSVLEAFRVYPFVDGVWVVALVAAVLLYRQRRLGWQLTIPTAAFMCIVGGWAEFAVFHRSSAPFAWPLVIERICTAIEAPLGLALLAAATATLWPRAGQSDNAVPAPPVAA